MKVRFELTVLQPKISTCSEKTENMLPHELGRFCLQSNKAVRNFTHLSATEIINYLQRHEGEEICGTIHAGIVNKPVLQLNKNTEPAIQFRFILALFLVFGPLLFSCNEKEHQEIKHLIEISINDKGEAYLPPVVELPEIKPIMYAECSCEYAELEPPAEITENKNPEILLDPVYIYGNQTPIDQVFISGAVTSIRCFTSIVEIDSFKTPAPEIKEIQPRLPLLVYPNPAEDQIHINYEIKEKGIAILSLFNLNGQKVNDFISLADAEPGTYTQEFNVSSLPSGIYILILVNNEHKEIFRLNISR